MARDIIKDIKTPNGDAIIDDTNDAVRVNVVAYLTGSPDRSGATANTLIPTNIDGT